MESKFLDPKTDVVFKKIFGSNPEVIKSFLNNILPLPRDNMIKGVSYLTPEQTPRIPWMKNTIVDVKCTDQNGRIFIIEMQILWTKYFGASKTYVQQLESSKGYGNLCPVYGIGIMNCIFDKNSSEWYHHYKHVNINNPNKVLEGIEIFLLELPKFDPQLWENNPIGTLWIRFLKEFKGGHQVVPPEFLSVPEIVKALDLAKESSYTKLELEVYDQNLDAIRNVEASINEAFIRFENEGFIQGKNQEKNKIALNLLRQNLPLEIVSSATGLTYGELNELKPR